MENTTPHTPGRGLDEPSQTSIEERALEIASADGRKTINEYDLAKAREEILGKGATEPSDESEHPGAEEKGEKMPS